MTWFTTLLLVLAPGLLAAFEPKPPSLEAFEQRARLLTGPETDRITRLARDLLGVPYAAGTLGGGSGVEEVLVTRIDSLDCMILLEYLLAGVTLEQESAGDLESALVDLRYREGVIGWATRRHFFSDWTERGLIDAGEWFPGATRQTLRLNDRGAGRRWLEEVPVRERSVWHVPASNAALDSLRNGDLIGFRTPLAGLDVTHTGLVLREKGQLRLLHASSKAGRVVSEPLQQYPGLATGFMILRLP